MEQKLSDTLVKAIDRSNPMMQNLQLASRFNKLIEEGENKLLCYYTPMGSKTCSVVYTDKSATKISFGNDTTREEIFPVDKEKHLFIKDKDLNALSKSYTMNLIYEDGSTPTELKGKFVEIQH